MQYFTVTVAHLKDPVFTNCSLNQQGAWVRLTSHCYEHENGGRIKSCGKWTNLQWQQQCQLKKSEILRTSPLWEWEGDDLIVWGYSIEREEKYKASKRNPRGESGRYVPRSQPAMAPRLVPGMAPLSNVMERNVMKGEESNPQAVALALSEGSIGVSSGINEVSDFPLTAEEARASAQLVPGCSPDFSVKRWELAAGRGQRDSKGVQIWSWRHYLTAEWSYEQERQQKARSATGSTRERAEAALKKVNDDIRRLSWPNRDVLPDKYAEVAKQRAALVAERERLETQLDSA